MKLLLSQIQSMDDSWPFVVSCILITVHYGGLLNDVMHEAVSLVAGEG